MSSRHALWLPATAGLIGAAACSAQDDGMGFQATDHPAAAALEDPLVLADTGPAEDQMARSGSRLKTTWWRAGAARLVGPHRDSELDLYCNPQPAADGSTRCLPTGMVRAQALAFEDAQCERPVLLVAALSLGCRRPDYIGLENTGSCPAGVSVYQPLGALHLAAVYEKTTAGRCSPQARPVGAARVFAIAQELPPARFSEIGVTRGQTADGLALQMLESNDGFRSPADAFWDERHGVACRMGLAADGATRCLPLPEEIPTHEGAFADAACSIPTAEQRTACGGATLGYSWMTGACPHRRAIFRLGPAVARSFARAGDGSCKQLARTATDTHYSIGDEIPPADLSAGRIGIAEDGERLQPLRAASAAGTLDDLATWDRRMRADCRPAVAADGRMRCLPAYDTYVAPVYGDPGCRRPLAFFSKDECWLPYAAQMLTDSCPYRFRMFPTSKNRHHGPVYEPSPDGCRERPLDADLNVYELGSEIPPGAFAELVRVVN